MTTPNPQPTFIFVDRRKVGKGRSLPNRDRLLKRIKASIKAAKPEDLDGGSVKGTNDRQLVNPVKVAREALSEPTFMYEGGSGEIEVVLPGNDRWLKGDVFPVESEEDGQGGGGNGPGEDGEDDFVINISRSEFYDVFFEDCILPDLEQTSEKEIPEAVRKPAGFQKEGTPGQLSVIRSYRNSIGRRRALTLNDREERELLQARLDELMTQDDDKSTDVWMTEVKEITDRIEEINVRISAIPTFEKVDHRYRKTEKVLVKSSDATIILVADISGSMDEKRKRIARKFFSLQYAFIKRKYPNTDLVFIYHTDEATEVTEEEFFTTRKNGGTVISPALALANQIIKERYDAAKTNIYLSYAGDGDNWSDDNSEVINELVGGGLLSKLRHMVYTQIGEEGGYGGMMSGPDKLWKMLEMASKTHKKLHLVKIKEESEVFAAFKSVYGTTKVKS